MELPRRDSIEEAVALYHSGRVAEAASLLNRVLLNEPKNISALHLSGVLHIQRGDYAEACARLFKALEVDRRSATILNDLGLALIGLGKFEEATGCCRRAAQLQPDLMQAYYNMGNAFAALGRHEAAISAYRHAVRIKPDFVGALTNLGIALMRLERHDEAIGCFGRALALRPRSGNALRLLAYLTKQICAWSSVADLDRRIIEAVHSDAIGVTPFTVLIGPSTPTDQLRAARSYLRHMKIDALPPLWQGNRYRHDKIRIGYLSADFHEHATAYLTAELFESHDRAKFEIFAYSFGPDRQDRMRARLVASFDRFFDIRQRNDVDAARLLVEHEIDIAVDLKGYTGDARPAILAHRPAPIQVNYLGYPGTMGAQFIDYIVADPIVAPVDEQPFFTERIVHLPDCYQVNDRQRQISPNVPTRAECGLPKQGIVFCCFNNGLKITPTIFDIWMRLLKKVPGSVLWMLRDNRWAEENLRREAGLRGVSSDRLVFAPRAKLADHLARQRLADIFLDTLPCNAHTTASDALWAGLPVLTCTGSTFAGRVASSLLFAVGLPELVTQSLSDYEAMALRLATDPVLLANLRAKLARNRLVCALFDTNRFRRNLEVAYENMWRIWQRGEKPIAFALNADTESRRR